VRSGTTSVGFYYLPKSLAQALNGLASLVALGVIRALVFLNLDGYQLLIRLQGWP
jgi:hypothetical protein